MKKTNKTKKQSVAEILTQQVIANLEKGIIPWQSNGIKPFNAKSGREYTGFNHFLLSNVAKNFNDPRFLTFKEVSEAGGSILKGEEGNIIYFSGNGKIDNIVELKQQCLNCINYSKNGCKLSDAKKEWQIKEALKENSELCDDYKQKFIPVTKYYKVWNIQQTTLKDKEEYKNIPEVITENIKLADEVIYGMEADGLGINIVKDKAGYDNITDRINVLSKNRFTNYNDFYAHIFKLISFSTGNKNRLDLPYLQNITDIYEYGTIVAEVAAGLIASECGIKFNIKRSAEYIAGLINILNKDSRFILMASNSAKRILEYVLSAKDKFNQKVA